MRLIKENYGISADKKVITLPVPLDTVVYMTNSSCGDFCMFDKKHFDECFPPSQQSRCSRFAACHTRYADPIKTVVSFSNLVEILNGWGVTVFKTYDEAKSASDACVDEHRQIMRDLGFSLREDGYCEYTEE